MPSCCTLSMSFIYVPSLAPIGTAIHRIFPTKIYLMITVGMDMILQYLSSLFFTYSVGQKGRFTVLIWKVIQ